MWVLLAAGRAPGLRQLDKQLFASGGYLYQRHTVRTESRTRPASLAHSRVHHRRQARPLQALAQRWWMQGRTRTASLTSRAALLATLVRVCALHSPGRVCTLRWSSHRLQDTRECAVADERSGIGHSCVSLVCLCCSMLVCCRREKHRATPRCESHPIACMYLLGDSVVVYGT